MVRTAAYTTSLKQQTQPVCGASDGGVSGPYACAARLRQVATERMAARCCRRTVKKAIRRRWMPPAVERCAAAGDLCQCACRARVLHWCSATRGGTLRSSRQQRTMQWPRSRRRREHAFAL